MKSFLPWFGGKSRMAPRLAAIIENTPHQCYCEPFMGAAHVFFARQKRIKCEVINDINGELVNLFRVVKHHLPAFQAEFEWHLSSRDEFKRLNNIAPENLTDIQRAHRFFYLQRTCFGARIVKPFYAYVTKDRIRFKPDNWLKLLQQVNQRLQGVNLERLPWQEVFRRYDRPHTFFYLDPPYHGHEDDYGKGLFAEADFETLAKVLATLQGKFLLSINDTPQIRDWFAAFHCYEIKTVYTFSNHISTSKQPATELLFSNLPPQALPQLKVA